MVVALPQQLEFKVVGRSQRRLQLRAKLGIRSLKADGVGLSQGPFDGRESRVRSTNQSQCPSLLEVRLKLLRDTAKDVQARSSGREVRQGIAGPTHLAKQHRALQERLRLNERIGLGTRRENFIELRFRLHEVAGDRGVGRQLNPDALDRRGGDRKAERLPIGADGVVHPPLFGVDGRQRPQSGHASTAIECHRANRQRALEEFACARPVAKRVIVHTNSVETVRFIPLSLNFFCEGKRAIIKAQRLIEVAERVIHKRGVGDHPDVKARIGLRTDIGERALEPAQRFRQTPEAPEAQRPVLPCLCTSRRLVDGIEQLTRGRRSRHTLRVATLIEISQRNVRELQPGVITFASLHMEATQALQLGPCAREELGRTHTIPWHSSSSRGGRSDLDPRRGEECIGSRPSVRIVIPEPFGCRFGPLGRLRPVLEVKVLDSCQGERRLAAKRTVRRCRECTLGGQISLRCP